MAKWVCDNPPAPGMYGKLQVYVRQGVTHGRIPSPLCSKRVKTAPEFAKTRKYAELLATASPLASAVHRTLPANRERKHYQLLAGKAIQRLKEGKTVEEVRVLLVEAGEVVRGELEPKVVVRRRRKRVVGIGARGLLDVRGEICVGECVRKERLLLDASDKLAFVLH